LLAFGAVVDFLAEAVPRAPRLVADRGLEWAWRLAREPRRLARRYLLDDPPGLLQLRRDSRTLPQTDPPEVRQSPPVRPSDAPAAPPAAPHAGGSPISSPADGSLTAGEDRAGEDLAGTFVAPGHRAEVAVLVVTHDSADDV